MTRYGSRINTKAIKKPSLFCLSLIFYFSVAADVLVVSRAGLTRKIMAKTVGRACAQIAILITIFGSIQCAKPICKCTKFKDVNGPYRIWVHEWQDRSSLKKTMMMMTTMSKKTKCED